MLPAALAGKPVPGETARSSGCGRRLKPRYAWSGEGASVARCHDLAVICPAGHAAGPESPVELPALLLRGARVIVRDHSSGKPRPGDALLGRLYLCQCQTVSPAPVAASGRRLSPGQPITWFSVSGKRFKGAGKMQPCPHRAMPLRAAASKGAVCGREGVPGPFNAGIVVLFKVWD